MRTYLVVLASGLLLAATGCTEDEPEVPKFDGGDVGVVVDAALPDLPQNLKSIYNAEHPGCKTIDGAYYSDNKDKPYMAATRLTPASYPFTVHKVAYRLWNKNNNSPIKTCDNGIGHKFEVWVGSQTKPEANPKLVLSKVLPATKAISVTRVVYGRLHPPVQLKTGEHLFVAVEIKRDPKDPGLTICLQACVGENLPEHSYTADTTKPPYDWKDELVDKKQDYTFTTWALGVDG